MDATRFLTTARALERAIADPRTVAAWTADSALPGYDVAGLCGHAARAVHTVARYLDASPPPADAQVLDAAGYFAAVLGDHDPRTSGLHAQVRARGREQASGGPAAVVDALVAARADLERRLPEEPAQRPLAVLDGTAVTLGAYLETRLVELVVHLDDLAASVAPELRDLVPPDADEAVAITLARVAVARHGAAAVVRSLSRTERTSGPLSAL